MRTASFSLATVALVAFAAMSFWAASIAWNITPVTLAFILVAISAAGFILTIATLLGVIVLYFEGYDPTNG
jgi:FtsH-binding integral membrane protein